MRSGNLSGLGCVCLAITHCKEDQTCPTLTTQPRPHRAARRAPRRATATLATSPMPVPHTPATSAKPRPRPTGSHGCLAVPLLPLGLRRLCIVAATLPLHSQPVATTSRSKLLPLLRQQKRLSHPNLMLLSLLPLRHQPLQTRLLRPLTLRHPLRLATKTNHSLSLSRQGGRCSAPAFVMSKGAPC